MKWRTIILVAVSVLLVCAIALWVKPAAKGLSPVAEEEVSELLQRDIPALEERGDAAPELVESLREVLENYKKNGENYTASNSTIGLLHVACLFKKKELVRSLLENGADPNMRGEDDDSPLLFALSTNLVPGASLQDIQQLTDMLIDSGADMTKSGYRPGDFLTQAALLCENEDMILYLMEQKGARPDADTAAPLALHGWNRALARVLEEQPGTRGLLHAVVTGSASFEGNYPACLELLLQSGAGINDEEDAGLAGTTALFRLAEVLSDMPADAPHRTQAMEMLKLLLEHGADPYLRADGDETHPGFCPYDLLAQRPGLVQELAEYGLPQEPPPVRVSSGLPLLADVCRLAAGSPANELVAEHYDAIAALLAPSAEMLAHELYPQALEAAIPLLARVDSSRTADLLLASPLWGMSKEEGARAAHLALLAALREQQDIVLSKEFICSTAEKWADEGQADEAAAMVELLARCPDAQEEIDRYCKSNLLPLQAGGYAALLSSKDLPDARDSGVQNWLKVHGREANTDFLREALLLTSLERLWYDQMSTEEQEKILELMRRVEAPSAAAAYEQISRNLDNPEALDAILDQGTDWKFELEVATARYFLEHAEEFAAPAP